MQVLSFFCLLVYNSSSLCLFCAIWLAGEIVLHFNKFQEQESRNYFPSAVPKMNNIDKNDFDVKVGIIRNELLILWILSMLKLWRITHKLNIKPFGFTQFMSNSPVSTSIKSTKIKFISINMLGRFWNSSSGLWGIVNNAGMCYIGNIEAMTHEDIEQLLAVNFLGPVYVCKAFLPLLRRGKGRLVNTASNSGVSTYLRLLSNQRFSAHGFSLVLLYSMKNLD